MTMRTLPSLFLMFGALAATAPLHAQPMTTRAAAAADVETLDAIIRAFYDVISGPAGQPRNWARDSTLYTAAARFVYETGTRDQQRWQAHDHATYIAQVTAFLDRGFFEREIHRVVHQFGGMAHVFSTYEWTSPTPAGPERGRGINSIELVFERGRWWITFAQWASESADQPIPPAYLPAPRR